MHKILTHQMTLKMILLKLLPHFPRAKELTHLPLQCPIYVSVNGVSIDSDNKWLVTYSAPSHYLNQCLFIVNWTLHFSEIWIKIQNFSLKKIHLKLSSAKMAAILSRGRWVTNQWPQQHNTKSPLMNKINISSRKPILQIQDPISEHDPKSQWWF